MVSGVGETPLSEQRYQHPDSPMTGDYLTSTVVSFEKIKLTNNEKPATGQVSCTLTFWVGRRHFFLTATQLLIG